MSSRQSGKYGGGKSRRDERRPIDVSVAAAGLVSEECEKACLAAMMIEPSLVKIVLEVVAGDMLVNEKHRLVYSAIRAIDAAGGAVDERTVEARLKTTPAGETGETALQAVGGLPFITDLVSYLPSLSAVAQYATIVRDLALKRELVRVTSEISQRVISSAEHSEGPPQTMESILAAARMQLDKFEQGAGLAVGKDEPRHIAEFLDLERVRIAEAATKTTNILVPSGIAELDRYLDGGLIAGETALIGGSSGAGKTTLGHQWCEEAARHGFRTLEFHMEMSGLEIVRRAIASHSKNTVGELRYGRVYDELSYDAAERWLRGLPMWVDQSNNRMSDIDRKMRRFAELRANEGFEGPCVFMLDFIARVRKEDRIQGEREELERLAIMYWFTKTVKDLGAVGIVLSQLNKIRDGEAKQADFKDAQIDQAADVAIMITQYDPDVAGKDGLVKFKIVKNRSSRKGAFDVAFMGGKRFVSVDESR